MIHAILNTKGGVGKSLIAFHIFCSEAARLREDFEIYELDAKNSTSKVFHSSKILEGKGKTLTLEHTEEAMGEAIYQSLVGNKEVIIDIGGGTDTDVVLKSLAATGERIRYYVPMISSAAQLKNLEDTYAMIERHGGSPNLIINQSKGWNSETSQAVDIFGDGTFKPDHTILKRSKNVYFVPESPYFGYAERNHQLIGDFITTGELNASKAKQILMEMAEEDAAESGMSAMKCFSIRWAQWQEIRKAYDYYQKIAEQDLLDLDGDVKVG